MAGNELFPDGRNGMACDHLAGIAIEQPAINPALRMQREVAPYSIARRERERGACLRVSVNELVPIQVNGHEDGSGRHILQQIGTVRPGQRSHELPPWPSRIAGNMHFGNWLKGRRIDHLSGDISRFLGVNHVRGANQCNNRQPQHVALGASDARLVTWANPATA